MIQLEGKYNKDCKIFLTEVEEGAIDLIKEILNHEVSKDVQIRIMPDTHVGKGIVIGFTMPVTHMLNPNYIGVDIGCSVSTHKLNKRIEDAKIPDLDRAIRRSVPMGMHIVREKNVDKWWVQPYLKEVNERIAAFIDGWNKRTGDTKATITVDEDYIKTLCEQIGVKESTFYGSVGTLGGGNHFIEVGEVQSDKSHYLTIHSGSRNFGLKICSLHAKKMMRTDSLPQAYYDEFDDITKNTIPTTNIPRLLKELRQKYRAEKKEYFLEGDDMYQYLIDMIIAQTYARFNHKAMAKAIFKDLGTDYFAADSIHSMHNYIDTTDWVIRKGAIRSYVGERMVIPFNMRDGILICEGKSNADWNCSAPHGAGRVLARKKAINTLSMDEFTKEMEGVYSTSVCKSTLDESPMAYKDKNMIIDAITDTAHIIDSVRPILNIKALS